MFNLFVLTTALTVTGLIAVTTAQTTAQTRSCQNGGSIVSMPKCQCSPGFKGHDCSLRVRPCDSGPCKNGGNCTDEGIKCFQWQCECLPGFKGLDCSKIVQPCEIKPCKNNGVCMNEKEGEFTCKCKSGFGGQRCDKRDDLYDSEILNNRQDYIVQLNKWLGGKKVWKLCYRATDNGWLASIFHYFCDYKKPTVTIIRCGSYIFGAYTEAVFGGSSSGTYRSSYKSFIFSFVNKDNFPPFKSPVKSVWHYYAISTGPTYGPTFGGGHDIYIADKANENTLSYTNFGHSYQLPSGYSSGSSNTTNLLAGTRNFTPDEMETFYLN